MNSDRQLWIILAIVFFGFLGLSMPYLIFPALFLDQNLSIISDNFSQSARNILLGVTLAAYPLGQFIGSPVLGTLSDDYGRKNILSVSLLIAAICTLLTGLAIAAKAIGLVIISRFAAGLMEGNLSIARAMAADRKEMRKEKTFGWINATASIAYILGPLLGGILSDSNISAKFSLSTPFYIIAILFLCLSCFSFFMIVEKKRLVFSRKSTLERLNLVKQMRVLLQNKSLGFALFLVSLFTLSVDIFYEFGPVYLTLKWMLCPGQLAIFNGVLCLGLTIGSGYMVHALTKRLPSRLVVQAAIGAFLIFLIGIVFIDQQSIMLGFFIGMGLSIGIASTYLTVKVSDAASAQIQGEVMGVQTSIRVLGDALICLLGGVLLTVSSKASLLFAALIASGALYSFRRQKT